MTKKEYMKPAMCVVHIKTQAHLLDVSNAGTQGLGSGQELQYSNTGGNQSGAWSRSHSVWDDDE